MVMLELAMEVVEFEVIIGLGLVTERVVVVVVEIMRELMVAPEVMVRAELLSVVIRELVVVVDYY